MMWLFWLLLAWCVFAVGFAAVLVAVTVRRSRRIAARRPRAIPLPPVLPRTYLSWNATRPHHHGPRAGVR